MIGNETSAYNKYGLQGFVRIELYDKHGNKKIDKTNRILPGGKNLMLQMAAGELIHMNGSFWGYTAKQGVCMNNQCTKANDARQINKKTALTNVLLNLSQEQLSAIGNGTHFLNIYNSDLSVGEKVVGYANMEVNPAANGKEGSPDFQKGADVIAGNIVSRKFKYADGVATGTINAVAMMPYSALISAYGENYIYDDAIAPGFRLAVCLDKVNAQDSNFVSFSSSYCPPGVTGITGKDEIISNYSANGFTQHKVNLVTGEVIDIETPDTTIPTIDNETQDYIVDDDYLYTLKRVSSGASVTLGVYKMSTKTLVKSITISTKTCSFLRFLKLNDVLYITGISYANPATNVLFKLKKGTADYWSALDTSAASYEGIASIPASLNGTQVCIGNYGDKYIMYVSRNQNGESANRYFATGYIFTDLNDIGNTIVNCIPSLYYSDVVFKNDTCGGVLSLGLNRSADTTMNFIRGNIAQSKIYISTDPSSTGTEYNLTNQGVFYTVENNWCNAISIAVLEGDAVINKGATDVLYLTYGYRTPQ